AIRQQGENTSYGIKKTPKEVVNAWMNSEGHRKNIMNPNFSKIGVGVAQKSGGSNLLDTNLCRINTLFHTYQRVSLSDKKHK
ncbi:hypothetical protein BM533_19625, partial [Clostridioides difficile]